MDPNETLRLIRESLAVVTSDQPEDSEFNCAVNDLADGFEALDGWLTRGGFLPADWQRAS